MLAISEVPADTVKASNVSKFYSLLNNYHFYLCDDTSYTAVELDCPAESVLNVYQYQYGKVQTAILIFIFMRPACFQQPPEQFMFAICNI